MATSCGTWSRLTKATIICPQSSVSLLVMYEEVVVQFNSNGYIFNKGIRGIDIGKQEFLELLIETFFEKGNIGSFVLFEDGCMGNEFGIVFCTVPVALSEFVYLLLCCLVSVRVIECCFQCLGKTCLSREGRYGPSY